MRHISPREPNRDRPAGRSDYRGPATPRERSGGTQPPERFICGPTYREHEPEAGRFLRPSERPQVDRSPDLRGSERMFDVFDGDSGAALQELGEDAPKDVRPLYGLVNRDIDPETFDLDE